MMTRIILLIALRCTKLRKLEQDVAAIKEAIVERKLERFSRKDIIRAFFGAFLFGLTAVFNSLLPLIAEHLSWIQVGIIIIATILVLVFEIFFIGWTRVKGEKGRGAIEFTVKRLFATYFASLLIATFLVSILGFYTIYPSEEVNKIIFILCLPCATGAVIADLVKRY